jgi:hypothetical protein
MQGGKNVVTSGVSGTPKVMGSYPQCRVTVYLAGTLTVATIYSDNSNTPLANPFTSSTTGSFYFYAANGRYDVTMSSGGLPAPVTLGDVLLADPSSITPVTAVTSFNGRTGAVLPIQTDYLPLATAQLQLLRSAPNAGNNNTLQFATNPTVTSNDFMFAPQTPGGSLTSGINTVALTPCPLGVAGGDLNHYLYISGGTGTAEAVLIIGGTCTSGAPAGTISFSAVNNHVGAWTVQSASAGIVEAVKYVGGVGVVNLPVATMNIYASIVLPTTVSLLGKGSGSANTSQGSILSCVAAANPCMVIADGLGTATFQGLGIHSKYTLMGPSSGSGLWVGGGAAGLNAAWTGSYTRFEEVSVLYFNNALTHNRGNFVIYNNCAFAGLNRALLIPSTGGGEHQPLEFYGTLLTVNTGAAVQMDDTGFDSNPLQFFGGQVSGAITGNDIYWESYGTHYEPNDTNSPILSVTGAGAIVKMSGGILSVHGTVLNSMFDINGTGFYQITLRDGQVQADVGMVVTNLVSFVTTLGGKLRVENMDIAPAGTFTNLYSISKATLDAATLFQASFPVSYANTAVTAGATITIPKTNYPIAQQSVINGGTVGGGITAVSGLTPYVSGSLITSSQQTFVAGATIGNSITTRAGMPYQYWYDGTKIWFTASPEWISYPGTVFQNAHTTIGTCNIGSTCNVTLVGPSAFSNASNYSCTATDNTTAAATKVVITSASTFVITGTGTDQVSFICVGN